MTDARLPDRWLTDRRLLKLPDDAFRLFVTSLMWSVANRTDGVLDDSDLTLIPRVDPGCHASLAKADLWRRNGDQWVITVFDDSQTSSSELDALAARRLSDRRRKAAQRLREAHARDGSWGQSRDSHAESVRTGQDRTGAKTEGRAPPWLPAEFAAADQASDSSSAADVAEQCRPAEGGTTPAPAGVIDGNSVALASEHNGSGPNGSGVQQTSIGVHLQSQATDRYARERECPDCGSWVKLRRDGALSSHRWIGPARIGADGKLMTRCAGGGSPAKAAS